MGTEPSNGRGRPSENYTGNTATGLAAVLAGIARSLDAEPDLDATMHRMVRAAVATVPGAESAGITQVRGRGQELDVRFSSDDFVVLLDQLQYEYREGPCLQAAYEHRTVRVEDFETETRWPLFAAGAAGLGARSLLSVQLFVEHDNLAALNIYSRQGKAFDDDSEDIALLFAAHASIAVAGARRDEQLSAAVNSRDLIGQAKGILMERYGIDADVAFQVMVRASQDTNTKLRDVAVTLTRTGRLADGAEPTEPPGMASPTDPG